MSGQSLSCDLCIIGAGIAGLNALFVATLYLPKTARVILIDRNSACGGMWTETYDHARLHQPHRMFTVGDMPWRWDRPADYLATGAEVQTHLADCLTRLRGLLDLVELFGCDCEACDEIATPAGPRARIRFRATGAGGACGTIEARRTINAAGWNIRPIQPLALSSRNVVSTTPNRLLGDDTDPLAPAVIVGGGKTGMDTAQALIQRSPGRKVILVNGRGTVFGNRDMLFPKGAGRWWQGTMVSALSRDVTMRFDGRNTDAVFDYFRRTYAVSPDGKGEHHFFSTLSVAEAAEIGRGLNDIVGDYLDDIVDTASGPRIVLRHGPPRPLRAGSLIVNCTGHMMRLPRTYEPYVSPLGTVLSVTSRSSVYFLSSSAAYFLTHVFLLGKLQSLPLYELDMDELIGKSRKVFFLTSLTHSFFNMMVIMDNVPISVFGRCGLDLNRWFPLPRRLAALAGLKRRKRAYIDHCRGSLDRVRLDYGIRCGPLGGSGEGQRRDGTRPAG